MVQGADEMEAMSEPRPQVVPNRPEPEPSGGPASDDAGTGPADAGSAADASDGG
jgi:hypothetical protein